MSRAVLIASIAAVFTDSAGAAQDRMARPDNAGRPERPSPPQRPGGPGAGLPTGAGNKLPPGMNRPGNGGPAVKEV